MTGGFIVRVDKGPPDFQAGGRWLQFVYPDAEEMLSPERRPQLDFIVGFINGFAEAMRAPDFRHPSTRQHYSEFIDVDAWIDHNIINALTKNVDGMRFSAYFYKERGGRLVAGPVWDFDRSMGTPYDPRAVEPEEWKLTWSDGSDYFNEGWWRYLFRDPDFKSRYRARFKALFGMEPEFATDGRQFDRLFADGDTFAIGELEARAIATPGHTDDSLTYLVGDAAFVGDTVFAPETGTARVDFPGGDARKLYRSIRTLFDLPADTRLFLCHDYPPAEREAHPRAARRRRGYRVDAGACQRAGDARYRLRVDIRELERPRVVRVGRRLERARGQRRDHGCRAREQRHGVTRCCATGAMSRLRVHMRNRGHCGSGRRCIRQARGCGFLHERPRRLPLLEREPSALDQQSDREQRERGSGEE